MNTGNLPTTSTDGSSQQQPTIAPLPQVFEFAMAAVAAQEVVDDTGSMTTQGGGSPGLFHATYCYLSITIVCFITAMMHLV